MSDKAALLRSHSAINPAECDKDSCLKPDADVLAMRPPSPVSRLIDSEQTLESTRRSAKSRPATELRHAGIILSIYHENPRMADMLQKSMMESADVPRRTSRPFMEILLEAKQEGPKFNKGRTFLIKGYIVDVGSPSESRSGNQTRGAYALEVTYLRLFFPDELETRERGDVIDVQLETSKGYGFDNDEEGQRRLKELFNDCPGNVKVILSPQREGTWYPFIDASTRKGIPAEFRSQGVGLLRLGDDMGNNGRAFLSSTSGQTFLDEDSHDGNCDGRSANCSPDNSDSRTPRSRRKGSVIDRPDSAQDPAEVKVDLTLLSRDENGRLQLLQELEKNQFFQQVDETSSWQEKVSGLSLLNLLLQHEMEAQRNIALPASLLPRGEYKDVIASVLHCTIEKHVRVSKTALTSVIKLAYGLRQSMSPYVKDVIQALLAKLKENNKLMIPLVNEALDSLDSQKCLSLSDLLETVEAAVDPTVTKLGSARAELVSWAVRSWQRFHDENKITMSSKSTDDKLPMRFANFYSYMLSDADASVRLEAMKALSAFLPPLDNESASDVSTSNERNCHTDEGSKTRAEAAEAQTISELFQHLRESNPIVFEKISELRKGGGDESAATSNGVPTPTNRNTKRLIRADSKQTLQRRGTLKNRLMDQAKRES